ncbi:hypothetical protein [Kitasatospora sp. NPDC002965]|uniref:hypothetical protein n=1 Tax=Kitasatospora sp. NPDC002965 TaxID=3154775 RepID=UPI0033A09AD7
MNSTCQCGSTTTYGPGVLAAHYLYERRIRAERSAGGRRFRVRRSDFRPADTLSYLGGRLDGGSALRLDVTATARELGRTPEHLLGELQWLAEDRRFLHTEGFVNGVTKTWVNPAVACDGGTDPRPIAARYRFPYPVLAKGGLSAPEPVRFLEYSDRLWDQVYLANRRQFDNRRFPDRDCQACFPTTLHPV